MNKKRLILVGVVVVFLLSIVGVIQYRQYMRETFIIIDEESIRRDSAELDYRGKVLTEHEKLNELKSLKKLDLRGTGLTISQYDQLQASLPSCEILWDIPFQGDYLDMNTTSIAITALALEDFESLSYLTALQTVDARGCLDFDVLMELRATFPNLTVHYQVPMGDDTYPETTSELTLENASASQVKPLLAYLPNLTQITFTGSTPDSETICTWKKEYPQITFVWDFTVCGVTANSLDTQLDLSGIAMESVEEVENALDCFYNLELVDMSNCGIPSEELDALWKRHPETRIVWVVKVGVCNLRTDITFFMPYQFGYDGYSKLWDHQTAELKYCVDIICMDMGHMGITDYSFLQYMPKMKYLVLAGTGGTDFSSLAYLKELVFLEIFMTKFDQAEVLTGLTKLEDLNLGNSGVDNIEPLLEMTWLKRLWLPSTRNVTYAERDLLRGTLTDTVVMFACHGSTGGGWRESPNYYAMRDILGMSYFKG